MVLVKLWELYKMDCLLHMDFVNLAGRFASLSHLYIRPCWVGLYIKHALPRYCRTLLITVGKALGGASVPGMHRCILMSDDVFGRKHELHHSWYNPLCTLSPASPSTSLQPGMPRVGAILYGLPKKQIIMHCKNETGILNLKHMTSSLHVEPVPSNHMPPHKYSGWWGKTNEWWIAGQQCSPGRTAS